MSLQVQVFQPSPCAIEGVLTGLIFVPDIRSLLYEDSLFELIVVRELMRPLHTLSESAESLYGSLRFVKADCDHLPVVDSNEPDHVLGCLDRAELFKAYNTKLKIVSEEK